MSAQKNIFLEQNIEEEITKKFQQKIILAIKIFIFAEKFFWKK